eukprot:gnl/MRDRNA2_/MRDRNA2_83923_c0_seq2.p1 gnl/MRDRNA2_/MRDRNA2_83923_c0~~gnl/MRDRNA2_/MRDRNA2_83923_c0_seq2.p1  ORF type:complete len:484 (-),score=69.09 gnl/MRDRNA2_/MRDRNA2_83923_c0_seq2:295-1746(-)
MTSESESCQERDVSTKPSDGASIPAYCKWQLTFKDNEMERAYQHRQRQDLCWTAMMGFSFAFVICMWTPLALVAEKGHWPNSGPLQLVMNFNTGAALYSLIAAVILKFRQDEIDFRSIEVLVVAGTIYMVVGSIFTDFYRVALMYGEDPHDYWDREHFSDSGMLLTIDLIITATHLFCPIRSCVSWLIPLSGVLGYTLVSYLLGTKDAFILEFIVIQLGALAFFSWYGRRRSEKESRLGFAKQRALADTVKTKEKEVIEERVRRFDAEHENERNIQVDQNEIREINVDRDSSIWSLSITTGNATLEQGAMEMASHYADKGTDPLLVWSESGWKCQRCSKPPLPPSEGLPRQNSKDRSGGAIRSDPFAGRRLRQGVRSNTSASSSESSLASGPAQLLSFELTPQQTIQVFILDSLQNFNTGRNPDSCCPYHAVVLAWQRAAKRLWKDSCNPLWVPFSAGQCRSCGSMFAEADMDVCEICGFTNQ